MYRASETQGSYLYRSFPYPGPCLSIGLLGSASAAINRTSHLFPPSDSGSRALGEDTKDGLRPIILLNDGSCLCGHLCHSSYASDHLKGALHLGCASYEPSSTVFNYRQHGYLHAFWKNPDGSTRYPCRTSKVLRRSILCKRTVDRPKIKVQLLLSGRRSQQVDLLPHSSDRRFHEAKLIRLMHAVRDNDSLQPLLAIPFCLTCC